MTRMVAFLCNICETPNELPREHLTRERPSCTGCGSTVRFRAMFDLVTPDVLGVESTLSGVADRQDSSASG